MGSHWDQMDAHITQLMDCKPLSENEIKNLCDKVMAVRLSLSCAALFNNLAGVRSHAGAGGARR